MKVEVERMFMQLIARWQLNRLEQRVHARPLPKGTNHRERLAEVGNRIDDLFTTLCDAVTQLVDGMEIHVGSSLMVQMYQNIEKLSEQRASRQGIEALQQILDGTQYEAVATDQAARHIELECEAYQLGADLQQLLQLRKQLIPTPPRQSPQPAV